MKKLGRIGLLILSLLLVAVILCGCGQNAEEGASAKRSALYGENAANDADMADEAFGNSAKEISQNSSSTAQVTQNRKIIEYVNLTVETKKFDKLINDINAAVEKTGGYIENSEIGGISYYEDDIRSAELKIRIPKAKKSDFSDFIDENSNVVNRSVSSEDVTDNYIDTQSRIKALKIEKETLEKLLADSKKVSDMLTVYEKLTDVISEIESQQGRLNQMDNLIDYTTFTVYITEVEKETPVEKQSWFKSTWNALTDNLSDVWDGFLAIISFLVAGLPYWILLGINAIIVVLIIRHCKKKRIKRLQNMNKQ